MQLKAYLAGLALATLAFPAEAGICTLSLSTQGTLTLSSDGQRLGSEEGPSPSPGTITILSIGSSTLTVAAPVWAQTPGTYQSGGETFEVRYSAPLSGGTQPYTSSQTSFAIPNLVNPVLLTMHNRVTTTHGFAAGAYLTHTVVTCS